ncbi:MAG: serine acetyltransferase [Oscillospiraceae bacterium]|jgi:serine O-acetyltransferase|nr:serine acetyltransferase [Oscillospiraceae bacterium]MCI2191664.1 serine acetyltransferase [Oscillospiraceae bacterium]
MLRDKIIDYSKGDNLNRYWSLFRRREQAKNRLLKELLTFLCNRSAYRHSGYIGNGAKIAGLPFLPHGLHGVYISRYANIGLNCWIYQNVTIGEINHKAPHIGNNCLIGAGATVVGNIQIGDNVRIGAGAVVSFDVPDNCTVVSQPPRVIERKKENAK